MTSTRRFPPTHALRRGFTLGDLLAVFVIISLLTLLLLGTLAEARQIQDTRAALDAPLHQNNAEAETISPETIEAPDLHPGLQS